MEVECCEKLIVSNSNEIAVKRNVWNLFPLETQLDVFRCLRAYDLYKKAIYVSNQWRKVIEKHKRTLPKYRQLTDHRKQNELIAGNYDKIRWQKEEEQTMKNWEFNKNQHKIREKRIKSYALLCSISFIAAIVAQPISVERISATLLFLAVSLKMGNAYSKFFDDPYKFSYWDQYFYIFRKFYSTEKLDFLKHVWLAYLGMRTTVFVIIGILRHIITADNILYGVLWILHLPEAAYLMNWSINVCASHISCFFYGICRQYEKNIERLNPNYRRPIGGSTWYSEQVAWYSELPIHANVFAWALAIPKFSTYVLSDVIAHSEQGDLEINQSGAYGTNAEKVNEGQAMTNKTVL
ncbi:hypothetical protein Ddc_17243 [Ditylenchus destructor]|nr:hypothetical protein Ddc_17243 [Ditylenchus destructor]